MALGNGTGYNGGPLVFLTPRNKNKAGDKVKPHYSIGRVGEDGRIAQTEETATNVEGDLTKVEVKEREFTTRTGAKEKMKEVVLYFADRAANESYRLPVSFNIAGRSLFNSLATLAQGDDFTAVKVDYYENKKGYDAYGLSQRGNQIKWKYKIEEIPEIVPVKDSRGKLIANDYTDVNEFFEKEILALAAKVNKAPAPTQEGHTEQPIVGTKNTPAPITNAAATVKIWSQTRPGGLAIPQEVDDSADIPF